MSYYQNSDETMERLIGTVVSLAVEMIPLLIVIFGGHGSALFPIVWNTIYVWVVWAIVVVLLGVTKILLHQEFHWLEFGGVAAVMFVSVFGWVALMFLWTADLQDHAVRNSYAVQVVYEEEYVDESCTTREDDDGDKYEECHDVHIGPFYYIVTADEDKIFISSDEYDKFKSIFGQEHKIGHNNGDVRDGDILAVDFQSGDQLVPTSFEYSYINYVRASDNIIRETGHVERYQEYLVDYPEVQSNLYGPIDIDRVIVKNAQVLMGWQNTVDQNLSQGLATLEEVDVNVLVYIVDTDQGFYHALSEYWVGGKKNDAIVLIGMTQWPYVDWCRILSWTDSQEFKIGLEGAIYDLDRISDADEFSETIMTYVRDSYEPKPIEDFEYLRYNLTLAWWAIVIAVILVAISQAPFMILALSNEF